eukprot:scaffold8028_cov444-Prasinococcus_capsulatus_cf.AAC.2
MTCERGWKEVGVKNKELQELREEHAKLAHKRAGEMSWRAKVQKDKEEMKALVEPLRKRNLELEYRLSLHEEETQKLRMDGEHLATELDAQKQNSELLRTRLHKAMNRSQVAMEDSSRKHLQVNELSTDNVQLQDRLGAMVLEQDSCESKLQALSKRLRHIDDENGSLSCTISRQRMDMQKLQQDISESHVVTSSLQRRKRQLETILTNEQSRSMALQRQLDETKGQLRDLRTEGVTAENRRSTPCATERAQAEQTVVQHEHSKIIRYLCYAHGRLEILFIRENQDDRVSQIFMLEQPMQLILADRNTLPVIAIYDQDHCVRVVVVRSPGLAQLVLAPQVPHLCSGHLSSVTQEDIALGRAVCGYVWTR